MKPSTKKISGKPIRSLVAIALASTLLAGCGGELPLIGNVQEKIVPLLDTLENAVEPLKGLIHPLRERFFPKKQDPSAHRHSANASRAAGTTGSDSDETDDQADAPASPIPVSQSPEQKKIESNMSFDHWRSQGIRKIYEGETLEAINCFKKALAIRPSDANIQDWIFLAENPGGSRNKPGEPGLPGAPTGGLPAPPAPAPSGIPVF